MNEYAVKELESLFSPDGLADSIVYNWTDWRDQRSGMMDELEEQRNFVFATDTLHTLGAQSQEQLPWHNRTTVPKLCQIRDNLHANYIASLFPNDNWMQWEGYTEEDDSKGKREAIQAYMSNKTRISGFRDTVSQLLYDYIDTGNAFADVIWVNETKTDKETGEKIPGYIGPKAIRVGIHDIVFDPTAISFEASPKITRKIVRIGELVKMQEARPDKWIKSAIEHGQRVRGLISGSGYTVDEVRKASGYDVDGFGDLYNYYSSGYVELLEFEGTAYDPQTGELLDDYIITVMDRCKIVRKEPIPAWKRNGYKVHTAWRKRPDNLYGMGPLANLVGMQYRLDHLENAKADAWDLIITPMWKRKGDVQDFEFYPNGEVVCGEDGDIEPLTKPTEALAVNNEIAILMQLMEEFAGAPREAMGIRTPGEKTAFEVQALENAAGRIFQEKITQFEIDVLEPLLNNMLETAVRNMTGADVIRVMDDDLAVADFLTITKEDITAKGKLRPIGARHFAQRAQLLQNLVGITNSQMWPKVERHFSDIEIARLLEETLQLQRFSIVRKDAAVFEREESQRLANQAAEDTQVQQATPLEEDDPLG
jgi:hypothetical protein